MCGITGIWNLNEKQITAGHLEDFTNSLAHRGPDGFGFYKNKSLTLGLGHRRLSILDLSDAGKQPMSFANERYWITYNGEIFNFIELRQELLSRGYTFNSESDTEVILASYHLWGKDCLLKFNGMWAFAIWDDQEQTLFLARDHFGIKPLYYFHIPDKFFAFASETIAFKHLGGIERQPDENHVNLALQNTFVLEGRGHTIYKNIQQLLPGHCLVIEKNKPLRQQRWWNTCDYCIAPPSSYDEQVAYFMELFKDACTIRMRSDVPIATALSGGVDSSSVYCMLHHLMKETKNKSRMTNDWQRAFIGCFPGSLNDEKHFAEEVISYTDGDAVFVYPENKNVIEKIITSTRLFDSIYLTPISVVTDIYAAMNKNSVKVSMDGHGVDEMLLGYPHMVYAAGQLALKKKNEEEAAEMFSTYNNMVQHEGKVNSAGSIVYNSVSRQQRSFFQKLYDNYIPLPAKKLYRMIGTKTLVGHSENWLKTFYQGNLENLSDKSSFDLNLDDINSLLFNEFHNTTLPTILRNFDRASMQSSVEIRMPFIDHRLVSYIYSLPLQYKVGNGFTKRILRDSMSGIMPESIRNRTLKIGLNAPMPEWFSGIMKEYISDVVHSQSFGNSNFWNAKPIRKFIDEKNKASTTWSWHECNYFWPFLNAHIILNDN